MKIVQKGYLLMINLIIACYITNVIFSFTQEKDCLKRNCKNFIHSQNSNILFLYQLFFTLYKS